MSCSLTTPKVVISHFSKICCPQPKDGDNEMIHNLDCHPCMLTCFLFLGHTICVLKYTALRKISAYQDKMIENN